MKALIVTNAYIKNKSQLSQAERVAEELKNLGVFVDIKKNFSLAAIENGAIIADKYDFCVFLDKDRVAARLLEGAGLRLFNSSAAIELCDDKMLTNIALSRAGIPLPDCIYAPLCYYPDSEVNKTFLNGVAARLGFPLVAKTNYGSLGAGVTLITDGKSLHEYESKNLLLPHFYQRYVGKGYGEDVRVIVVGGKFTCAMKRTNLSDFRSNIELGGKGENFPADKELIKLCEGVAKSLRLDYCGVDVLSDGQGHRFICEVNSNAFFAAAERVCRANVAKVYAEYMVNSVDTSALI